jgi:anaerobic selenocysteine-containing dehydrogenase
MFDAVLDHACTGHATIKALRAEDGIRALNISHVANPTLHFDTPSGKIEFFSEQAQVLGLPPLPSCNDIPADVQSETARYPLTLTQGRTMAHFHSFYNNGQMLPTLAKRETQPALWMSESDAQARDLTDGDEIRIFNAHGELVARAHVTNRIPPGTVWIRDGWPGLNRLTAGTAVLPDEAVDLFEFSAGQASFDTAVEVAPM